MNQDNQKHQNGPLAELRVLELEAIGPVPLAGAILSDLGADVVQVVRPGWFEKNQPLEASRRGRKFVELDLKSDEGRDRMLALAEEADVLLEGYRPGVLERLGIGPDVLLERNPRLVIGRMTGWGQEGKRSQQAGHDINYLSLTGHLSAITDPNCRPTVPLNLVADYGGGTMFLLLGVVSALFERANSGQGQVIDAAMVDGASMLGHSVWSMMGSGRWIDQSRSNLLDGGRPWYDVYATKDHRYMAVGAIEPQFYAELLEGLSLEDIAPDRSDEANFPKLRALFTEKFASETQEHWTNVFADTDACVTPVLTYTEATQDPHMQSRGIHIDIEGVTQPAPAPRFSRTKTATPTPPPVAVSTLPETSDADGSIWPEC